MSGFPDIWYLNFAHESAAVWESPLGRGGAQRRGGLLVTNTHPEAFGFCPSLEGIGYSSPPVLNHGFACGLRRKAPD